MNMGFLNRIRSGKFTDSDVAVFYIFMRDEGEPFCREMGNFVAHPHREKPGGSAFDGATGQLAQLAFYKEFEIDGGKLCEFGTCQWWMKPFILARIDASGVRDLKKEFGKTPSQLKKQVNGWFIGNEKFPTRVEPANPYEYIELVQYLGKAIQFNNVFSFAKVARELKRAFKKFEIPNSVLNDFLVATAVLLNHSRVDFLGGVLNVTEN